MISHITPDYTKTPPFQPLNFNYSIAPENLKPEISIITPFHNTGKVFLETVFCILNQSFQNFEWIIVDDCSKDQESLNMLSELSKKEARVKVLHNKENLGPGGTRNEGIAVAKGEFLFFVDSDDLIELTILEKFWIFLKINTEFAFCNSWHSGFGAENYMWRKGCEQGKSIIQENYLQTIFLARKSLFTSVKFDETIRHGFEDWDFWLQCALRKNWGYTIPEFLYWYRRSANISSKWQDWDLGERMKKFRTELYERYYDHFESYFPTPQLTSFNRGQNVSLNIFADNSVNSLKTSGKKRLFFIIPWMSLGGSDKFNLDIIKGLFEMNWEITIVTTQPSDNRWYDVFSEYTPDIFIINLYAKESFYTHILEYLINSRNPDCILMSNSEIAYHLAPLIKYTFPSIPLIDYNHMEEEYWNNGGYPMQSVIYQSIFTRNIVSSKSLKQWMVNRGAKEEKIDVVYTGSDFKKIKKNEAMRRAVREHLGVSDDLCVITFSGRLTDQKQPYVLLGTLAELSKKIKDGYILMIAGDGPEFESMQRWVSSRHLQDKIVFLGALSNEKNLELLQGSDIFFLPSLWEGISLGIYEAMASGLPIVGADVGGQKELVKPENGFLIRRGDPESEIKEYAAILSGLVQNPAKRQSMGLKSREIIESGFGIENMLTELDAVLSSSIENRESIQPHTISQLLKQSYASFFFERELADKLWYLNANLRSTIHNSEHSAKAAAEAAQPQKVLPDATNTNLWHYHNYELLPLWYKRTGLAIRILIGKRDWRSLYSSKYKPDPYKLSHTEWYAMEYDVLPEWYKKIGKKLKKKIDKV